MFLKLVFICFFHIALILVSSEKSGHIWNILLHLIGATLTHALNHVHASLTC